MDKAIQKEIHAHLDKASRRLNAAQRLQEHNEYEDAASRAYYAIYHAAQAALLTEGLRADTYTGALPPSLAVTSSKLESSPRRSRNT